MAPGSAAAFLRGCATLPPLASPSLCVALLTLAVAAAFFVIAPPHSAGLAAQTPTLTSAPDVATAPAHDDELAELMRSAAAFGAPSSVSCSGEAEHASCAFSNLYLVAGRLRFLLADTGGDGEDAASVAGVAAAAVAPFTDLALGAPLKVAQSWPDVRPIALTPKELQAALLEASGLRDLERVPVFLFQRLQPQNVYHHVWDDAATLFALLNDWLPRALRRRVGRPLGVRFVFADAHGDTVPNREVWEALSSLPAQTWEVFLAERPAGAVVMISRVFAGAAGRCVHRRHCVASPAPEVLLRFKSHLLAFLGVAGAAPHGGAEAALAEKAPPTNAMRQRPDAVLVVRSGRRRVLNPGAVIALLERLGYSARTVGPLSALTLREQLQAVANSSLVVFAHGAELGSLWLGMRAGACAGVLLPFLFSESFAWWAGAPLGLRIAPFYDAPANRSDARLAFRDSLPPRKPPRRTSDFEITLLYQYDMLVDVERLERTLWCA